MKVLLVNGSPHQHGCTDMALRQTAEAFLKGKLRGERVRYSDRYGKRRLEVVS